MKRLLSVFLSLCLISGLTVAAYATDTAKKYSYKNKITEWDKKNSDVEGWLRIHGTNIDYPVIFYPGGNEYYEARGYDKNPSKEGVIYAETTAKSGKLSEMSLNTVIYGHNWTNVSSNPRIGAERDVMFAQLPAFHHLSFAKEHQFINYANSDGSYVFQVFAVFYTEDSFEYYYPNPKQERFDDLIKGARARSLHNYDVDVKYGDHIITLGTCTRAFGKSEKQRFVVMGKMVPDGTEAVNVTAHEDYQKPKL